VILTTLGLVIIVTGLSWRVLRLRQRLDRLEAKVHQLEWPLG
jgi:hypothetical protein